MPKRTRTRKRGPLTIEQEVALFLARCIGSRVRLYGGDIEAAFPHATADQIGDGIILAIHGRGDVDHRAGDDDEEDGPVERYVGQQ